MRLCPTEISFTQDSIGGRFTNGRYLSSTFEELISAKKTPDDIPAIEVVFDEGKWWALTGNRRLFLYKKLEDLGIVTTIPVMERHLSNDRVAAQFSRRNTTCNGGTSIECRQARAESFINDIISKWKLQNRVIQRNGPPLQYQNNNTLSFADRYREATNGQCAPKVPPVAPTQPFRGAPNDSRQVSLASEVEQSSKWSQHTKEVLPERVPTKSRPVPDNQNGLLGWERLAVDSQRPASIRIQTPVKRLPTAQEVPERDSRMPSSSTLSRQKSLLDSNIRFPRETHIEKLPTVRNPTENDRSLSHGGAFASRDQPARRSAARCSLETPTETVSTSQLPSERERKLSSVGASASRQQSTRGSAARIAYETPIETVSAARLPSERDRKLLSRSVANRDSLNRGISSIQKLSKTDPIVKVSNLSRGMPSTTTVPENSRHSSAIVKEISPRNNRTPEPPVIANDYLLIDFIVSTGKRPKEPERPSHSWRERLFGKSRAVETSAETYEFVFVDFAKNSDEPRQEHSARHSKHQNAGVETYEYVLVDFATDKTETNAC